MSVGIRQRLHAPLVLAADAVGPSFEDIEDLVGPPGSEDRVLALDLPDRGDGFAHRLGCVLHAP